MKAKIIQITIFFSCLIFTKVFDKLVPLKSRSVINSIRLFAIIDI